jgi:hypothetical protein
VALLWRRNFFFAILNLTQFPQAGRGKMIGGGRVPKRLSEEVEESADSAWPAEAVYAG